ncbi:hypothetical protein BB558_006838 [Smittium angustum]|uniref:Uncharacterized protein n=1 Tax=Smittium angustum TaxID=133377 RepID=A0A2U1IWM9_SMIAN|nr:hypothetical protein BB558_006838 [Smittium angustum]
MEPVRKSTVNLTLDCLQSSISAKNLRSEEKRDPRDAPNHPKKFERNQRSKNFTPRKWVLNASK